MHYIRLPHTELRYMRIHALYIKAYENNRLSVTIKRKKDSHRGIKNMKYPDAVMP